jgi:hypothetical protein
VDAMQALGVLAQFCGGDPQESLPLHTLNMLLHQQLEFIAEFRGAWTIRKTLPIQIISPLPLKMAKSTAPLAAAGHRRPRSDPPAWHGSRRGVKINKKFVKKP